MVRVDLPGVSADKVDVTVENHVLSINAERRALHDEGDQILLQERFDGTISRKLRVPDWVDTDAVSADYTDGVLSVRLPLADNARARRIQINGPAAQPASIES